MADPATTTVGSTGLTAAVIALLGAAAGDYATIVFWALCGSLLPLASVEGLTRLQGAMMVLRLVLTAAAFTGLAAWWVGQRWGLPATTLLAPIAFAIAAFGDNWRPLIAAAAARLRSLITGRTEEPKP